MVGFHVLQAVEEVKNEGRLEQTGDPERVFQRPESCFVASFLGHAGFLDGRVQGYSVRTALGRVLRGDVYGLTEEYNGTSIDPPHAPG